MISRLSKRRRGSRRSSLVSISMIFLASFLSGSCQVIGGGRSPGGPVGGTVPGLRQGDVYQGSLSMDGGEIAAALEIERTGRRSVRGALQTSTGLIADGEGALRGSTLTLVLAYGGECPGHMALEGEWDTDARIYEGTVEATDCTGSSRGLFRFSAS